MKKINFIFLIFFIHNIFNISYINANDSANSNKHSKKQTDKRINNIIIKNNNIVDRATILHYAGVKRGQKYCSKLSNKIIKNLYATNLFNNISVSYNNKNLIINVKEALFISDITMKGNAKIPTDKAKEIINTTEGNYLDPVTLKQDIEKLKALYKIQGYFNVKIDSEIIPVNDKNIKLAINVKEGKKIHIKNISFVGNNHYLDGELKKILITKEKRWFDIFEQHNIYSPQNIEYDKMRLENFYKSVGYPNFKIISTNAKLSKNKDYFDITYVIDEGKKYKFNKFLIKNLLNSKKISDKDFEKIYKKHEYKIFDEGILHSIQDEIREFLLTNSIADVQIVISNIMPVLGTEAVDIELTIKDAPKTLINRININGNLKTEEQVIRKQLTISEGSPLNKNQVKQSKRNIYSLQILDDIKINSVRTDIPNVYDVNISVREMPTAEFGAKGGFDSASGAFFSINYSDRNLIGKALELNSELKFSKLNQSLFLGLKDRYFRNSNIVAGVDLSLSSAGAGKIFARTKKDYSKINTSITPYMEYRITDNLLHYIFYTASYRRLKSSSEELSISTKEQLGSYITSAIGHILSYNRLDNYALPKNGYKIQFKQSYAGLGGNVSYLQHTGSASYFKSFFNNNITAKLAVNAGIISGANGKKVKVFDRFNIGDATLRGFLYGGVGPRDKDKKESLGGQKYYTLSADVSFLISDEMNLEGVVYCDAGSIWDADLNKDLFFNDKSLKGSIGVGFKWITRMAPISFYVPLYRFNKKPYDETQSWHLSFATQL